MGCHTRTTEARRHLWSPWSAGPARYTGGIAIRDLPLMLILGRPGTRASSTTIRTSIWLLGSHTILGDEGRIRRVG